MTEMRHATGLPMEAACTTTVINLIDTQSIQTDSPRASASLPEVGDFALFL
jgi:hypothetical protein